MSLKERRRMYYHTWRAKKMIKSFFKSRKRRVIWVSEDDADSVLLSSNINTLISDFGFSIQIINPIALQINEACQSQ